MRSSVLLCRRQIMGCTSCTRRQKMSSTPVHSGYMSSTSQVIRNTEWVSENFRFYLGFWVNHTYVAVAFLSVVPSRSHSMHDLRMARQPPQYQLFNAIENPMMLQKLSNNKYDHNIYHTINFKPKTYNKQNLMKRNCISMENLKMTNNSLRKVKTSGNKDGYLNISNPQLTNISSQYYHMPFGFIYDLPYKKQNSKQSLATTNGSDDYLKYRDVAL